MTKVAVAKHVCSKIEMKKYTLQFYNWNHYRAYVTLLELKLYFTESGRDGIYLDGGTGWPHNLSSAPDEDAKQHEVLGELNVQCKVMC